MITEPDSFSMPQLLFILLFAVRLSLAWATTLMHPQLTASHKIGRCIGEALFLLSILLIVMSGGFFD